MLTGEMFIGATAVRGEHGSVHGINPATGETLQPAFGLAGANEVERACALAWAAFDAYRDTGLDARAAFLERIAQRILDLGDALIERAVAESGLPRARIEGERGRTVGQLRLFADVVREGGWLEARIDPALPERKPLPRADLRQRHIGVGPVAVFGASNFPLAFSVAGGDTASALGAGCPVIVKAHSAHPGTSELVGRAIRDAVADCSLPEGVFSLLFTEREAAVALVTDARIKAVGFTGSRAGGMALVRAANNRPEPIPVYAEMSSINPVFLMPGALALRAATIGASFVASLTMGAGQFCTNPGLVLALEGPDLDGFIAAASEALGANVGATMLTPGIHAAYERGVDRIAGNAQVQALARGKRGVGMHSCQAGLFATTADAFLKDTEMQEEIFGASSLVIRCKSLDDMRAVAERLEGQLTATIQMEDGDAEAVRALLPTLERRAGRILVNGYPTGVEVCHAMVHGGPFPATSDPRSTSVGSLAIRRFLRPVCYQDLPANLLPQALRDDNPLGIWRRVDGSLVPAAR
ncbi:aldehyde dehydrogenase (NADP(+)) [Noviherbaspirillum pedocola]|uniref:2,5-dioxovalerate dehydrogenase n=1 Tax=Noviherbaspirillum pedocola TaxID=2801341 RepID=A0A934SR38_9BURK|nr:aldehyde dehydrogenase (NADP(+)) [Noviherbaspirillum pedocola]MBK4735045.1 aldehyde dehydrogenase (NADP(+)) [Noviherbaspirillum pedocola]